MIRLLVAAVFLMAAAAPAFACSYLDKSVSTDTQPSTVAAQPPASGTTAPAAPAQANPDLPS